MTQYKDGILGYVVYSIGGHCGHEVIDRIFFDKDEAIKYQHNANVLWAKYMGSWDGTTRCFDIIGKYLGREKEFDFECDLCGYSESHCECFPKKLYKTEQTYEQYWSKERSEHNHKHSETTIDSDCKFCEQDKTLWWIPALHSERDR